MPRKLLVRSTDLPYHITTRSNNRDWFCLTKYRCWNIFEQKLAIVSERYDLQIIAFLLMSNHIHMLVKTPKANLGESMNYLFREVSKQIGSESGRINRIFGGRYKWCLIDNTSYFLHAYKYLYRNPIGPKLAKNVQDYPYSTIHYLYRNISLDFPIYDNLAINWGVEADLTKRINWLNTPYQPKQADLILRALRKSNFTFSQRYADTMTANTFHFQK